MTAHRSGPLIIDTSDEITCGRDDLSRLLRPVLPLPKRPNSPGLLIIDTSNEIKGDGDGLCLSGGRP